MTAVNHLDIVLISEVQSPAEEKMEEITSVYGKERERFRPHLILHGPILSIQPFMFIYFVRACVIVFAWLHQPYQDSEIKILINLY